MTQSCDNAYDLLGGAKKDSTPDNFPISFANAVAEILRRGDEATKRGIYSSSKPHPDYRYIRLPDGMDFTHEEVLVIGNHKNRYDGLYVIGLPDGIFYDKMRGLFHIPEIRIIKDLGPYRHNPNLRSAIITFEYSIKECDTYIGGFPNFKKTLNYLDYRKGSDPTNIKIP